MLTRSDGVESTLVELFDPSGLLSRQDPAPIPTPPRSNDEDSFRLCMELSGASWGSTRRSIPRTTEDASPAIQTPHETTHNTTTLTSGPLAISTLDVAPLLPRSTVNDPITPRTRSLAHHRPFAPLPLATSLTASSGPAGASDSQGEADAFPATGAVSGMFGETDGGMAAAGSGNARLGGLASIESVDAWL